MSKSPKTPEKRTSKFSCRLLSVSSSKTNVFHKHQSAKNFIIWYKQIIDNERQKLGLYLSEDVTLKWFGRTIRSRKKVNSFFTNHVEHSKHYFTSVESISKLQIKQNRSPRKSDSFISPSCSPELKELLPRNGKRRLFQSPSNSPEWAPGCRPDDEFDGTDKKRPKPDQMQYKNFEHYVLHENNDYKHSSFELNNKGDGVNQSVQEQITPSNLECGQGDCLPSTSSDSNRSHENLNAQLPKLAVECNGYVEFMRTRNNRADSAKWERKCKLQICYSEDPLNVGDFIVWMIYYSDESKCRRNLLAEFNKIGKEQLD
ncbi:unnamed protein product [Pieris macdunnoughi]|uniref:Uncharacterized protein n=1 Tax=Pieris macdunnoughi TaxID=345717 RepID=A0A821M5G3_9NEOP|nr:unnamed protein product [Pieris macdunnoughi]